ncbi:aminotransferase class I/II-fold pyridoxal phosphate-dependent enzyme [Spirillospora sp. NPDC047279]|uniref:pyridoxal phosphate-dependent decarboxylase family protein n=1 Tax=Spirillospora sp. NPDC047279 TaxID=3155478 RepID=UPI0033C54C39
MDPRLAGDLARTPDLLEAVRARAVQILAALPDRPAAVPPPPAKPSPLPAGAGLEGALAEFSERWEPGFSGSAGPRYLGFVTGGTTPAALAGDWLTGVLDQNAAPSLDSAASDLERETVSWLRELFGITAEHSGAFVSGATMSNMVGLAIAREWLGEQQGISVADAGVSALNGCRVYSATPHSSAYKALSMLGMGRDSLHLVPTLPDREAIDVDALAEALAAAPGPAIVIANAGTVNTVDFDDLEAIAALRERHPFWLHVDAAFGAFAALSPAHAHLTAGLTLADSICVDLHKWLNVPYDSAIQLTRRRDLQVRVFQNAAAYLGLPTADPDFVHLTPENSRRLRALPAWFALRAYGLEGHRSIVERNIAQAHRLASLLSPGWRLLSPVRLNVVCFAPARTDPDTVIRSLTASGTTFLTPTVYKGIPALRAAFSNWRTSDADVDLIARELNARDRHLPGDDQP